MKYKQSNTSIAIIGGGNIGTQFACMCAYKGYKVNLFSSKPELFDRKLQIVNEYNEVIEGEINLVSSCLSEVLTGCRVIFVSYPAFKFQELAMQMVKFIEKDVCICVLPGTGGAEFAFGECIKAGATLVGLQRVPSVARLEQYGKRVRCEGLRSELFLASIPNCKAPEFAEFIEFLWEIKCHSLPNYLSVTLTPSNPILHTARLRTLFADYENGKIYKRNPLFYGEWDDAASDLLIANDSELQGMLICLRKMDLSNVRSLKKHYESNSVQEMTSKLRSIKSLHNLASPMIEVDGGWIPNFASRYFSSDFPFGLLIIEELAEVLDYPVPNISNTMKWYRDVTGNCGGIKVSDYGIKNTEDIYNWYHQ